MLSPPLLPEVHDPPQRSVGSVELVADAGFIARAVDVTASGGRCSSAMAWDRRGQPAPGIGGAGSQTGRPIQSSFQRPSRDACERHRLAGRAGARAAAAAAAARIRLNTPAPPIGSKEARGTKRGWAPFCECERVDTGQFQIGEQAGAVTGELERGGHSSCSRAIQFIRGGRAAAGVLPGPCRR